MAIELTDDGTMDTVLRCSECGEEMRYNYDPCGTEDRAKEIEADMPEYPPLTARQIEDSVNETLYDEFVAWAIEDATADHECTVDHRPADWDSEPTEPQEGDITTSDHETFYQDGKVVLRMIDGPTGEYWEYRDYSHADANGVRTGARYLPLGRFASVEQAIKAYMVATQFWPNVWFISDHGNAHLMDLTEGK